MCSDDIAIEVIGLSKCYQIYEKPYHRLLQMAYRGHKTFYSEFWALRNVSFNVRKGETVGILGKNGSGKSTLLKMICGTLNPTAGKLETRGRIAAILELGAGFNPEFTGRENVYMKASILGLRRAEIDKRFESIADFAEIGDFMEQPVRTYSSGMMVRLAFAVSVNVDPEILVIDEALSVGDEKFQRKCFSRIETIKETGATILFVSHSGSTVVQLCDRGVLLDQGENIATDTPKKVYGFYQKILYAPDEQREIIRQKIINCERLSDDDTNSSTESVKETNQASIERREKYDKNLVPKSTIEYDSKGAYIRDPKILTLDGVQVNHLVCGQKYTYQYIVDFVNYSGPVCFGMAIKTITGMELGGAATYPPNNYKKFKKVSIGSTCKVKFEFKCTLTYGTYFLNAGVIGFVDGVETYIHRILDFAMFKVEPEEEMIATGIVDFGCIPYVEFG